MAKDNEQPKAVTAAVKTSAVTSTGNTTSNKEYVKERFEFLLTTNGNIICQRNFHIHSLNPRSLHSKELLNSARKCVQMIKDDLRHKTHVYLDAITPQIFNTEAEMYKWLECPTFFLEAPHYIITKDTDKTYVLRDDTYDRLPNGNYIAHRNTKVEDYVNVVARKEETSSSSDVNFFDTVKKVDNGEQCVLNFIIRDNGKELVNISFDGMVYPRFVRTNIDLSNSRNRYITEEDQRKTLESMLVDMMKRNRKDLIGPILREICQCCSCWSNEEEGIVVKYTDRETYSKKEYNYNIEDANNRWMKSADTNKKQKRS